MRSGLTWDADIAIFFGEADVEGVVESSRTAVYSASCGLTLGADLALFVGEADLEALALSGVTD